MQAVLPEMWWGVGNQSTGDYPHLPTFPRSYLITYGMITFAGISLRRKKRGPGRFKKGGRNLVLVAAKFQQHRATIVLGPKCTFGNYIPFPWHIQPLSYQFSCYGFLQRNLGIALYIADYFLELPKHCPPNIQLLELPEKRGKLFSLPSLLT